MLAHQKGLMTKNNLLIAIFIAVLTVVCVSTLYITIKNSQKTSLNPNSQPKTEDKPISKSTNLQFAEIGLELSVPNDLEVTKQPEFDENNKLRSYIFYIQNKPGGGSNLVNFQIYGLIQLDIPTISQENFLKIQDGTENFSYINKTSINGITALEGQYSGVRNRYFYMLYLDNRILNIAISEPTEENKKKADDIIRTIKKVS